MCSSPGGQNCIIQHLASSYSAGGRPVHRTTTVMRQGWGKLSESHNFPHPGRITCCSAPNSRPPPNKALHTICGNNTSIVSSSWWWAYKWPKHVEQIISAIKHWVASSWFSSTQWTLKYWWFAVIHTVVLLYAYMLILCENQQIVYIACDIAIQTTNDSPTTCQ